MSRSFVSATLLTLALCGATISPPSAEEAVQDVESKALDSTATQWSFQVAYQWMDYKAGLVGGQMRPASATPNCSP